MQTPSDEMNDEVFSETNEEKSGNPAQETAAETNREESREAEPKAYRETGTKTSEEARPRPTRKRRKKKKSFPIPAFLTHLGDDVRWYYDIRLWSPLLLLILILALVLPRSKSNDAKVEDVTGSTAAETQEVTEATTEEPVNEEAAALARLADSVGSGRSDNVKTIIMWVAINRSEAQGASGYGKTLLEEIARENQWQGYDENTVYSESTYEIALEVLEIQASGGLRPLDSDMLWLVLNDDGSVTVRNKFSISANEEWREKTVK